MDTESMNDHYLTMLRKRFDRQVTPQRMATIIIRDDRRYKAA